MKPCSSAIAQIKRHRELPRVIDCKGAKQNKTLFTFVKVPEEEEFTPTRCGGADVAEQVDAGIPEHAVKAQHHLQTVRGMA